MKNYINFINEQISRQDILIKNIETEEEKTEAINMTVEQFSSYISKEDCTSYLNDCVNFDISLLAVNINTNEIIGILLLGESIINEIIQYDTWEQLKDVDLSGNGLEGVALVIKPEYRKSFAIYKLIYEIKNMKNYNFITIQQFNNMDNTMNYNVKTQKIGIFFEDGHEVSVFYGKL